MNNRSQDPATVNIWFGSEWPSLRKWVTDALPATQVPDNVEITIVAESGKPDSAPGRIARWVSTAPALTSSAISIFRPGARPLPPPTAAEAVIGITELLLDPDPNQADQLYAVGIWTRIIPRRRKLLMRVTPYLAEEIVANAAAAQPADEHRAPAQRRTGQLLDRREERVHVEMQDPASSHVCRC